MIGFGDYHYVYESGREGDWFITGFSPRKNDLTLYINAGFDGYRSEDIDTRRPISQNLGLRLTGNNNTGENAFTRLIFSREVLPAGAVAIRAAVERARIPADTVSDVLMGTVLQAGQGQAPARQAAVTLPRCQSPKTQTVPSNGRAA